MRYVKARLQESDRTEACRLYFADALKAISDNTSKLAPEGTYMSKRLVDILRPDLLEEPDERTMDEIVASIWAKIGS